MLCLDFYSSQGEEMPWARVWSHAFKDWWLVY